MVGENLVRGMALVFVLCTALVAPAWAEEAIPVLPSATDLNQKGQLPSPAPVQNEGEPALAPMSTSNNASSDSTDPGFRINLGPGAMVIPNGTSLWGMNFGFSVRLGDIPLYLGLESGYFYGTNNTPVFSYYGFPPPSTWMVPITPTIYYRFDIANTSIHPFIGASAGVAIVGGNISPNLAPTSGSYYLNSVYFEGLIRPGVEFDLSPSISLGFEPRFGMLTSMSSSSTPYYYGAQTSSTIFVFSPVINLNIGF